MFSAKYKQNQHKDHNVFYGLCKMECLVPSLPVTVTDSQSPENTGSLIYICLISNVGAGIIFLVLFGNRAKTIMVFFLPLAERIFG